MDTPLIDQINDELIRLDYSEYSADQAKRRDGQYLLAAPDADGIAILSGGPKKLMVCQAADVAHALQQLSAGATWDEMLAAIRQHLIDEF